MQKLNKKTDKELQEKKQWHSPQLKDLANANKDTESGFDTKPDTGCTSATS